MAEATQPPSHQAGHKCCMVEPTTAGLEESQVTKPEEDPSHYPQKEGEGETQTLNTLPPHLAKQEGSPPQENSQLAQQGISTEGEKQLVETHPDSSLPPSISTQESEDATVDDEVSFRLSGQFEGLQDTTGAQCTICEQSVSHMSLRCRGSCGGMVHFACSRLPAYQIENLHGKQRRYTCEHCTVVRSSITTELYDRATTELLTI